MVIKEINTLKTALKFKQNQIPDLFIKIISGNISI